MRKILITVLTLLTCTSGLYAQDMAASQDRLPAVAQFHRCYSAITGLRAVASNPLVARVNSGQLTPSDACMQVFDKAKLVPISQSTMSAAQKTKITPANPTLTYTPNVIRDITDPEAVATLNRFQDLHRQFFTTLSLEVTALPTNAFQMNRLNDATEPALFLTRLLFGTDTQFKDVAVGNYGVRGIRSFGPYVRNYYTNFDKSEVAALSVPGSGIERGTLWGVSAYAANNQTWMTDTGTLADLFSYTATGDPNKPAYYRIRAKRSYGAGIMGLASYIAMNSGFPIRRYLSDDPVADPLEAQSDLSNASIRMHRRWAKNALNDLLCRPMPMLRTTDVSNLVANYVASRPNEATRLPFRSSATCSACHAAIDPMAAAARSFVFQQAAGVNWLRPGDIKILPDGLTMNINPQINWITTRRNFISMPGDTYQGYKTKPAIMAAEQPANGEYMMMSRDKSFYARPGTGSLRFRSYDGSLVWQTFTAQDELDGLAKMGEAIAAGKDLYVCAASRYLKHFTGIEVNLQDATDPGLPKLSDGEIYYRNVVVKLADNLKRTQSLRGLVRDIIDLDLFKKKGMRDVLQ